MEPSTLGQKTRPSLEDISWPFAEQLETFYKYHIVASSEIAQSDARTERAPENRKARAIPTTPSDETSPLPLWQ